MAKKLDLKSVMQRAAVAPTPVEIDPFDRAEEVLKRRPTGYVIVEPDAPKVEDKQETKASTKKSEPTLESNSKDAAKNESSSVPSPNAPPAINPRPSDVHISNVPLQTGLLGTPRFEEVPLELIDENPFNARHIYLAEKVAELSNSMSKSGQLIPGLAASRGERRTLIAGHYRKKAATLAGIKTLRLMVYDDVSDQDLYVLSYKENTEQTEQSPLDNALAWQNLLDKGVFSNEVEIAEAIGMSKANINKTLSILKLEPSVMSYVEQSPTSYALSVLYELVLLQKVAGAPATCDMASRVLESGAGRKEIQNARERHEAKEGLPSRRRQHETSRSYRLWNNDEVKIGNIKEWDSGKVVVDVNFVDQNDKTKFIETIRAWMAEHQQANKSSGENVENPGETLS